MTADFQGLRVAAFESRRADDMARLIQRQGGRPFVSRSMRETTLDDDRPVIDFANRVITGDIDISIFLTGVGFRQMLTTLKRHVDVPRFLNALRDSTTIVRGPKPLAALREVDIQPNFLVGPPHTWRELLSTIDQQVRVAEQRVALQEYGETNSSLIAGLEARGAEVIRVLVYRWDLPEDVGPLLENIQRVADGAMDVLMFTSAHQVANLMRMAEQQDLDGAVLRGAARAVVASIGPTTSEALRDAGFQVDLEASPSKMGQLVVLAAQRANDILPGKRGESRADASIVSFPSAPAQPAAEPKSPLPAALGPNPAPNPDAGQPAWFQSPFMKACRREPSDVTPVWLMRQAGRYMQEYRAVRGSTTFLELCKNAKLCSEIMCTAVERLGVDAAIIFSDLLPILEPMGLDLEFIESRGPVIHNPLREPADIHRVLELTSIEPLHFVVDTVKYTRADLPPHLPVIGFAGAPFTLASYAIEGGASRNYLNTKILMYRHPAAWRDLMERLARGVTLYLNAQIDAGAQVVQLFDSWAGCLSVEDYRSFVLPYVQQILHGLRTGTPVINFATGNPALLPLLAQAGVAVVGVDWRIELDQAWEAVGQEYGVQGNLDPLRLVAGGSAMREGVETILRQAAGRPGHVFNLGHGVLPQTPVDNACDLVKMVHDLSAR